MHLKSFIAGAFITLVAGAPLAGCKVAQESGSKGTILASLQPTASDEAVVFAYNFHQKTGLYQISVKDARITELVSPQPGVIANPCLAADGRSLLCIYVTTVEGKFRNYVAAVHPESASLVKLLEVPQPMVSLALNRRQNRFYFVLANDFGRSSPVAGPKLRDMELCSTAPDGTASRREAVFSAYLIGGQIRFDAAEKFLYLNVIFAGRTGPGPRPLQAEDGPYQYNVDTQALTYLVPPSLTILQPKMVKKVYRGYYTDFLQPAPAISGNRYYLKDNYQVYEVNTATGAAAFVYRQPEEEAQRPSTLHALAPLNASDGFVINKSSDRVAKFLLQAADGTNTEIPVNMESFLGHFN